MDTHQNPRQNPHRTPDPERGPAPSAAIPAQHGTRPETSGATARGSTAVNSTHNGPRHVIGSAARAIRIFAETAIRVTILGGDGVKL